MPNATDSAFLARRHRFDAALADAFAARGAGRVLQQPSFLDFALFFFDLRAQGVDTPAALLARADAHNARLLTLLADPERRVPAARLEPALFTAEIRRKLGANFGNRPPAIDQSDLGRFLVLAMSVETCRKLAVLAETHGLVTRTRSPYGGVLVSSLGVMEDCIADALAASR